MCISLESDTEKVVLLEVKDLISCGPVSFRCDHLLAVGILELFWKKFMQFLGQVLYMH